MLSKAMMQVRSPRKSAGKTRSKIEHVVKRAIITGFSKLRTPWVRRHIRNSSSFSLFIGEGAGWEADLNSSVKNTNNINNSC